MPILVIAFALLAAACSGDSGTSAETSNDLEPSAPRAEATDALAFLGSMTTARSEPAVLPVSATAASLSFTDGASLEIPSGAFADSTELAAQEFDLDFASGVDGPTPWGRAFVVSTVESVDLATPVRISIARPAADLRAIQLTDGKWAPVAVTGDDRSAHIEIEHFSEVVTMVVEAFGEQRAADEVAAAQTPPANGDAPALFLQTCVAVISSILELQFEEDSSPFRDPELPVSLAWKLCTNALIEQTAPNGQYVSTQCVGRQISVNAIDFREAVQACAEADAAGTSAETEGDGAPPADAAPVVEADTPGPAAIGPLFWSGPMVTTDDAAMISDEPFIEITRDPATGVFTVHAQHEETGTFNYDSAGTVCTQVDQRTFDGEGTFFDQPVPAYDGDVIFVSGEFVEVRSFSGCPKETEESGTTGTITLLVTDTGIVNADEAQHRPYWQFDWSLEGVPIPLGE